MLSLARYYFRKAITRPEKNILVCGIDAAGKTCALNELGKSFNLPAIDPVLPTIGQNFAKFKFHRVDYTVWDLGGQRKFRHIWDFYFEDCNAIVYVIDSSDTERFDEAITELKRIVSVPELSYVPLCILANKQDQEGALDVDELQEFFNFDQLIVDRQWTIVPGVVGGDSDEKYGTDAIIQWIQQIMKNNRFSKNRITSLRSIKKRKRYAKEPPV